MSDEYEKAIAMYEAERNRAWHSWFAARGDVSPSDEHTRIFDGGFRMAWELRRAKPQPAGVEPILTEYLERLGQIAERLYNYDPKRGPMVAGDIRAAGAELIDMAQPLKALAAQPAQGLEWSHTLLDGVSATYEEAEAACAELGAGWRLPTRVELESLLDLTRHAPAIDTDKYPDTESAYYWTSTPCAWNEAACWAVDFYNGDVDNALRHYYACVRAVRDAQPTQEEPTK